MKTPCAVGLYGIIQSPKHGRFPEPSERISSQPGRPFSFAFGSKALGEFLVYGENGGRQIDKRAALGGSPGSDRKYRLLVFKSEGLPWHAAATLANLEPVMKEIYGDALPDIADAVNDITKQSFHELTGCNVTLYAAKPWEAKEAGCKQAWADLVNGPMNYGAECDKPPMTVGGFTTRCPAEQSLLSFAVKKVKVPALELRAFMANFLVFNALWTGYGYTANDYDVPLEQEFWVPDMKVADLPSVQMTILEVKADGGPPAVVRPFDASVGYTAFQ